MGLFYEYARAVCHCRFPVKGSQVNSRHIQCPQRLLIPKYKLFSDGNIQLVKISLTGRDMPLITAVTKSCSIVFVCLKLAPSFTVVCVLCAVWSVRCTVCCVPCVCVC